MSSPGPSNCQESVFYAVSLPIDHKVQSGKITRWWNYNWCIFTVYLKILHYHSGYTWLVFSSLSIHSVWSKSKKVGILNYVKHWRFTCSLLDLKLVFIRIWIHFQNAPFHWFGKCSLSLCLWMWVIFNGSELLKLCISEKLVFNDKKQAMALLKTIRGSRFKIFKDEAKALNFARMAAEDIVASPKPQTTALVCTIGKDRRYRILRKNYSRFAIIIGMLGDFSLSFQSRLAPSEKSDQKLEQRSFREPVRGERIQLKVAIEAGDVSNVTSLIWSNPHYLISVGETPVVLHVSGALRLLSSNPVISLRELVLPGQLAAIQGSHENLRELVTVITACRAPRQS